LLLLFFQDTAYLRNQVSNEREKQEKWKRLYYEVTSKMNQQQQLRQQQKPQQQSGNASNPATSSSGSTTVGGITSTSSSEPVDLNNNQMWMRPQRTSRVGHDKQLSH